MIRVRDLHKHFGSDAALAGIDFDVQRGEVIGLLGPNGAGKTTTMRILTGAMPPTRGEVTVAGHDVARQPLEVKRRVGYLPEVPPLYPEMRVGSYLRFVAELKGIPRAERRRRVDAVLGQCWLEDRAGQPIEQLSKGYRQRVGLAQAIIHRPELLILDEPTSGLDPRQIIEVRQLIRQLAGEHTVILSSHILSEIAASCERLVIMNRGRVVATDTVDNLTRRFTTGDRVVLQARGVPAELRAALKRVAGVETVVVSVGTEPGSHCYEIRGADSGDMRARVAAAVVVGGWELLGLRRTELSLEEIFLRLTEETTPRDASEEHRAA